MTILYNVANIHSKLAHYDTALMYYTQALAVCMEHRLYINQILVLGCMGSLFGKQDRVEDSRTYFEQVIDISRRIKYPQGLVNGLRGVADILILQNNAEQALPYLLETITILADLGDASNEALSWRIVARLYAHDKARCDDALKAWSKVRKLAQQVNSLQDELEALEESIQVLRTTGRDNATVWPYLSEAARLAAKLNRWDLHGRLLNSMAIIEWENGRFDNALRLYEEAATIYERMGDESKMAFILNSMAVILRSLGRPHDAIATLQTALSIHRENHQQANEGNALAVMGHLKEDMQAFDEAREYYHRSLTVRREIGDRIGEGWMLYYLGQVSMALGSTAAAGDYVKGAHRIAAECDKQDLVTACLQAQIRSE